MLALHAGVADLACSKRMRDRRGERRHQDRKQSQPTADLPMETTQDALGDTIRSCRELCHGLPFVELDEATLMRDTLSANGLTTLRSQ